MNIPYLLKILGTDKISELVENIDAPVIDFNLAIWEAEKNGYVEVDVENDKIYPLRDPEVTFNPELANKLLRVIQHYHSKELNVTRGRLTNMVKNVGSQFNYPYHEYLMALQYLIDDGQIEQKVESVPKAGKRPYHKFVFLQDPDNPNNDDWNKRELNKWIENWNRKK